MTDWRSLPSPLIEFTDPAAAMSQPLTTPRTTCRSVTAPPRCVARRGVPGYKDPGARSIQLPTARWVFIPRPASWNSPYSSGVLGQHVGETAAPRSAVDWTVPQCSRLRSGPPGALSASIPGASPSRVSLTLTPTEPLGTVPDDGSLHRGREAGRRVGTGRGPPGLRRGRRQPEPGGGRDPPLGAHRVARRAQRGGGSVRRFGRGTAHRAARRLCRELRPRQHPPAPGDL